jgi:hypothetical protein
MVSFTNVEEYEDVADIAYRNNGTNFEEPPPKRKRVAPNKRSQSLETPAMVLEKAWETVGEDKYSQQETLGSQLSTPPKYGKRIKSMSSLRGNPKFKPPFQNTKITKPSFARGKEVVQVSASDTPISYQSFTTTEEAVFLSKTTLEKLSAFRYKPSTVSTMPLIPVPVDPLIDFELPPLVGNQQAHETPSSDDGTNPSSDSFFKQATWHTSDNIVCQKSVEVNHDDFSSFKPATKKAYSHRDHPLSQLVPALSKQRSAPFVAHEHLCTSPVTDVREDPVQTAKHLHYEDSYDDPTSSEGMLLDNLLNGVDVEMDNGDSNRTFIDESDGLRGPRIRHLKVAIDDVECSAGNGSMNGVIFRPEEIGEHFRPQRPLESEGPGRSAVASDGKKDVSPLLEIEDSNPSKNMASLGYQIEIERSDLDEDEPVLGVSRDFYGSDEFDEGLDDEDLLAVLPDVVIPQTPSKGHPVHEDHTRRPQVSSSPAQVERIPIVNHHNDVTARINSSKKSTPPPRIFCSEPVDEYSMDEEDEDEMLKLPGFYQNVVENFIPPASVQECISNDNDPDTEEYDCHLLFSPATSPAKVALGNNTDSHSASQSPQGRSNIDISPLQEEEDWSFMRTNDDVQDRVAQMMSDPCTEPPSAVPNRRIIDITSSSPVKRTVSVVSRAQTCATQVTATSAYTIIDDSHEYEPIENPFARPPFAALILDRCPVM